MITFKNNWPSLLNDFIAENPVAFQHTQAPAANIIESENLYEIQLAAPGYTKEDFKIEVLEKALKISAEKTQEKTDHKAHRQEFAYGSFSRSFRLINTIDTDQIEATYKDGILSISLPKKEEAKPKEPRLLQIA